MENNDKDLANALLCECKRELQEKQEAIAMLRGLLRTHAPHLYTKKPPDTDIVTLAHDTLKKHVRYMFLMTYSRTVEQEVTPAMVEMYELGRLADKKEVING